MWRHRDFALFSSSIIVLSAAAFAEDLAVRWQWTDISGQFQPSSIQVLDLDGDSSPDLLALGCAGKCWVGFSKGGRGYRQIASSTTKTFDLDWLTGSERSGDSAIILSYSGGSDLDVESLEGGSVSSSTFPTDATAPTDALVADLDGDGALELVVIDADDLFIHDFLTGALEIVRHGFGGLDLDIGQIDTDSQLEIAIAAEFGACWILDGATLLTDWGAPSGCGVSISLAQVLPDAPLEVLTTIFVDPFHAPRLFDPPLTSPVWTGDVNWGGRLRLAAGDLSPEPGFEVVSAPPYGTIELLRGSDGVFLRQYPFEAQGGIAVGDPDEDSAPELLFAAPPSSSQAPVATVDPTTGLIEHSVPSFRLERTTVSAGDLDSDGDREIVAAGTEFGGSLRNLPVMIEFSGRDGGGPGMRRIPIGTAAYGGAAFDVGFAFVGSSDELEVCASWLEDSVSDSWNLSCIDALGAELWRLQTNDPRTPVLITDLSGDGLLDVVVGTGYSGSESIVGTYRADLGWFEWQTPNLYPSIHDSTHLCHGEVEGGLGEQIVAIESIGSAFRLVNPGSGAPSGGGRPVPPAHVIACTDLDADGQLELLAAGSDGQIAMLDPATGVWGTLVIEIDEYALGLASADVLGLGTQQLVVATESSLRVFDPLSGTELASLEDLPETPLFTQPLVSSDVDGDGRSELILRTWNRLLVVGLPSQSPVLLIDGFESGDAAYWSRSTL